MTDTADDSPQPRRMLTLKEVLAAVPVGRTTLYRLEKSGRFPASRYVSAGRRLWFADEVAEWQTALPHNSRMGKRSDANGGVSAHPKNV